MADGKIIIDTKIDDVGAKKGLTKLKGVLGKGFGIIKKGALAVGTTMAAVGGYALKVGSDFEEGMSKVKAISGATSSEMEKLGEKAKEMGAKTKFSATESAAAMEYMGMAGWKSEEMLNGIEGVMNLAAASGEDLALTSNIVTDALTAFGMQAKDSSKFADLLASAASNSNTNVAMLGESFKYVAPVAGALGMSAKDTSFALGLMANSGIKASSAGTALRASLTNLTHPSKSMKVAMDKLGISITDGNGKVKEGKVLYDDLRQKFSKLTAAQKTEYAATIFGKEAMSGMLAIINASDSDYKKLYENLSNCDGAAQKMADTMNDNLKGQVVLLKSALEGLGIQLYESVDNPMKDVVKTTNTFVGQLSKAFKTGGFDGLITEFGNILTDVFVSLVSKLPKFIELGTGIVKNIIKGLMDKLPILTQSRVNIANVIIDSITELLPMFIELGFKMIEQAGIGLRKALPTLIPKVIQCIFTIVNTIIENLPLLLQAGMDILNGLIDGIFNAIPNLIVMLPTIILTICNFIMENLPLILEQGVNILLKVIEGILTALPQLIEMLPTIINTFVNVLVSNLPRIIETGIELLKKLIDGIIKALPQLIAMLPKIINTIVKVLTEHLPEIITAGVEILLAVGMGIIETIPELIGMIPEVICAIIKAFAEVDWLEVGVNIIKGIAEGIAKSVGLVVKAVKKACGKIWDKFTSFFGICSPSKLTRDGIGVNLLKGIGVGVKKETPQLEKQIDTNMGDIYDSMKGTVEYESVKTGKIITNKSYDSNVNQNTTNKDFTQNVTIVSPENTPSENARQLKRVGRDLAFGY